jgi:hypothetical protein
MTELQIGQSLTYEQVMALPDGAKWRMSLQGEPRSPLTFTAPFSEKMNSDDEDQYYEPWYLTDEAMRHEWYGFTLISLPSQGEPSLSQGVDYGSGDTTVITVSTSAPVAEIEKEAALALLTQRMDDCHDAMNDAMEERDYDMLYDFRKPVLRTLELYAEAYDYAKSKGAL